MSGVICTKFPSTCNPEMVTHEQLVVEYESLSDEAFTQAQLIAELSEKLSNVNECANNLASNLYALCDSYDAGDQAAILQQVKRLSERRIRQGHKVRKH